MIKPKRRLRAEQARFGYPCPSTKGCGGIVHPRVMDYSFCKGERKHTVHDALLGVCDRCGALVIPAETQHRIDLILKHSGAFSLRIDPELHARLAEAARKNRRSLTKEIEYRLEESLKAR